MYALNNDLFDRPPSIKKVQARPGQLPRLLVGVLFRSWALITALFDGDYATKWRLRARSRRRMLERLSFSVKKTASFLALILIWAISPALGWAQETEEVVTEQAENAEVSLPAEEAPPPFTLTTQDDDRPNIARLKAALRLLKYAQVTTKALQSCTDTPEAVKVLRDYQGRNGKTIHTVMNLIKENGGLSQEIKRLLDLEVTHGTAALLEESGCEKLTKMVIRAARDIYEAGENDRNIKYKDPEVMADYRLVREKH